MAWECSVDVQPGSSLRTAHTDVYHDAKADSRNVADKVAPEEPEAKY